MSKITAFVDVSERNPELDVSIDTGEFCFKTEMVIPEAEKEKICLMLDKAGYSSLRKLNDMKLIFCAKENINGKPDSLFCDSFFECTTPMKQNDYSAYINDFDSMLQNYDSDFHKQLLETCEKAVVEYYGVESCKRAFSLQSQIECVCEIAENILDHDTNKERHIARFWDRKEDPYGSHLCSMTVSLDDNLDNVYHIEICRECDGETSKGYINDVEGIEQLEQALYGISNGTALVIAPEFSDKPVTCEELYLKTIEKFNKAQEIDR